VTGVAAAPRVLMVVEKLHGLGGAQQQALRLARALRAQDVDAKIVTGRWRRSEPAHAVVDGVSVTAVFTAFKGFHWRGFRKVGMYIYLLSLWLYLWRRRREYDLIHVHSATVSAFAVAVAGRRLKKPTLMKVMASGEWSDFRRMRNGSEVPGSAWMLRKLRTIDRVVCLNPEAESECAAEGFGPERRVSIPNGFPVRDVPPAPPREAPETIVVVFAGRLDAQKGPGTLVEAAGILLRGQGAESPCIEVRLLGDGPQRAELERRASALGLERAVRFLGRVDDVARHLREATIFVLPSSSEGISNALLEAAAHGLPCVATRIPGNVEIITDRETGLLVPRGDAGALAASILELARDASLRERLSRAVRLHVERNFDIDEVARRYALVYRELLDHRASIGVLSP